MASSRRSGTNEAVLTYGGSTRDYVVTGLTTWESFTDDVLTTTSWKKLTYSNAVIAGGTHALPFHPGETVSCVGSGADIVFWGRSKESTGTTGTIYFTLTSGTPLDTDTLSGDTSGDTADVDVYTSTAISVSPVLECYDDAASFDDYVSLVGATTDTTYFRIIRPATGQGHDGTPNNGFTIICTTDTSIFIIQENYSQVQDIVAKINVASGTSVRYTFLFSTGGNLAAYVGCIAFDSLVGSTGVGQGFGFLPTASNTAFAIDCLAHNCEGDGFRISTFAASFKGVIYNCTATNNATYGFRLLGNQSTGVHVLTNCLGADNTTADFSDGTTNSPTRTVTYCASKDATADDWAGDGNHISHTFTFADGTDNFHLASNDVGAIGLGIDLSSNATYAFDDDIDKQTRMGSWDIGFDEVVRIPRHGFINFQDPGVF